MGASGTQPAVLAMAQGQQVNAADVIALLREVYADGIATSEEAEELIAFDRLLADAPEGWSEFFATSIADHLVERTPPFGAVDAAKTAWLAARLLHGRQRATESGFAAVVRAIETAREVAPEFAAFAIADLRASILAAKGPASSIRIRCMRSVDPDAAACLSRILLAAGGAAGAPVSREEAEALFDLHDAVAGGRNAEAFDDLFFKAIVHHLLAHAGNALPVRREFLAGDVPAPVARVGADESAWLLARIMRDGKPTGAEFALLRFFSAGCDDDGGDGAALRRFLERAA